MKNVYISQPINPVKANRLGAFPKFCFKGALLITTVAIMTSCFHDPEKHLDASKKGTPITPDGSVMLVDKGKGNTPGGLTWQDSKISYLFRIKGKGDTVFSFISSPPSDILIDDSKGNPVVLHPGNNDTWVPESLVSVARKHFDYGDKGGILYSDSANGVRIYFQKISKWDGCVMLTFQSKDGMTSKERVYSNAKEVDFGGAKYYVSAKMTDDGRDVEVLK